MNKKLVGITITILILLILVITKVSAEATRLNGDISITWNNYPNKPIDFNSSLNNVNCSGIYAGNNGSFFMSCGNNLIQGLMFGSNDPYFGQYGYGYGYGYEKPVLNLRYDGFITDHESRIISLENNIATLGFTISLLINDINNLKLFVFDFLNYPGFADFVAWRNSSKECINGQLRCSGDTQQKCINYAWTNNQTCQYGCLNGVCNNPPFVCNNGDKKCNENFTVICTSNSWIQNSTSCQFGCDNGNCQSNPIPNNCLNGYVYIDPVGLNQYNRIWCDQVLNGLPSKYGLVVVPACTRGDYGNKYNYQICTKPL